MNGENRAGPVTGYDDEKTNMFIIAGNPSNREAEESFAILKSPFLKSNEHPVECFSFWFQFGQTPEVMNI